MIFIINLNIFTLLLNLSCITIYKVYCSINVSFFSVSGETSNQSVVTCSICDFQCARKKDLRQHITKSHGFDSSDHEPQNQIIYACSECNRTFQHSYSLSKIALFS